MMAARRCSGFGSLVIKTAQEGARRSFIILSESENRGERKHTHESERLLMMKATISSDLLQVNPLILDIIPEKPAEPLKARLSLNLKVSERWWMLEEARLCHGQSFACARRS